MEYPYLSLEEALCAADFDPRQEGCMYFTIVSDIHYGRCSPEGMQPYLPEIAAMDPLPEFFHINGDLIISASLRFGQVPDEPQKEVALDQLRLLKMDLDSLPKELPVTMIAGNHDTYPGEVDCGLIQQIWPEHRPYNTFEKCGVRFFLLNGHSVGFIDDPQMTWLSAELAKVDPMQPIMVFVHQPSMRSLGRERGISNAISRAFSGHTGDLWLVGGHEHENRTLRFQLKNTVLTEFTVTNSTSGVWGEESGGYWIYCIDNGALHSRIFRMPQKGYRIDALPSLMELAPAKIEEPFSEVPNVLWKAMVGESDQQITHHNSGYDCVYFFSYSSEYSGSLPLKEAEGKATYLSILGRLGPTGANSDTTVQMSSDGENWIPVQENPRQIKMVYTFNIPKSLQKQDRLLLHLSRAPELIDEISGFALSS